MLSELKIVINRSSSDLLKANVEKSVDSRGMACPYPSFESVKAMNTIKPGDVLEVLTDNDESALRSIPSVCDKRRWEFLVLQEAKELWRVRIRKPITA
jgi:tRNA 2-thiouridine synthesizing protein A